MKKIGMFQEEKWMNKLLNWWLDRMNKQSNEERTSKGCSNKQYIEWERNLNDKQEREMMKLFQKEEIYIMKMKRKWIKNEKRKVILKQK